MTVEKELLDEHNIESDAILYEAYSAKGMDKVYKLKQLIWTKD